MEIHALHEMIGFNAFSFSCFLCDLVFMLEMVCAEIRIMISQALGDVVLNHRCAQKQVCFRTYLVCRGYLNFVGNFLKVA